MLYILCGIFALSFNQNIFFSHRKLWQTSIQTWGALLCSFSLLSTLPCTFQILISWSSYICLFMSMCHYSLWALPPFLVTGRCPQTKSQAIVGWSEAQLSVFFFLISWSYNVHMVPKNHYLIYTYHFYSYFWCQGKANTSYLIFEHLVYF